MRVQEQGAASQRLPVLRQPFLLLQDERTVPDSVRLCDSLQLSCGICSGRSEEVFLAQGDRGGERGRELVAFVLLQVRLFPD